jgi:translation initiation factor 3 subunit A
VVQVRIDHRTGTVTFGTGVGMTQDGLHDGPSIQNMPSEQMRNQLVNMANAIDKAINIINPKELKVIITQL